MKEQSKIRIIIRPLEGRGGEHIAYFENEFLQAAFSVQLKDNIFGALALQAFSEMIRKAFAKNYRSGEIDFVLSSESMSLESKALLDVLDGRQAVCA